MLTKQLNISKVAKMIIILSTLLIIFSCSKSQKVDLKLDGVIQLNLPIGFYPNRSAIHKLNKDTLIYIYNWRKGEIFIKNNGAIKTRKFPGFSYFFTSSYDSIFIMNKYKGEIILLNSNLDSVNSWKIPRYINNTKYLCEVNLVSDFYILNRKLFLTALPNVDHDLFFTKQHEIIYNLDERKVEKLYMKFPHIYTKDNSWGNLGIYISKTINNKNEIFIMYPMYDNVFRIKNGKIEEIKLERSKYLENFPPEPQIYPPPSNKYIFDYAIKLPCYNSFHYDKFRDLYYRVVSHKQALSNGKLKNTHSSKDWSVMIFDKDFNLLNEIKFKGGMYFYEHFDVRQDGIYVLMQDEDNFDGNVKLQKIKVEYEN